MITKDKLIIRLSRLIRAIVLNTLFWFSSFLFFVFMTGEYRIFHDYLDILHVGNIFYIIFFLSVNITVLFIILDIIFNDRVMRFLPSKIVFVVRSLIYFLSAYAIILIATDSPINFFSTKDYNDIINMLPGMDIHFLRFLGHFYLSIFIVSSLNRLVKRIGRGNFRSWIFGLMDKPREAIRIFMFVDMKSSTTIAEKLEHKKFSHLVQDVFSDLSVVDLYKGEIYQYVGDGAIISWNLKKGLRNNNFLKAFYAFVHGINNRKRYYIRKYGIVPQFKAGVHVGKVMVLQVGRIRRDISYNGDTMNTAARIESMCNEYKQHLLISGALYEMIKDKKEFNFKEIGDVKLKGKRKDVNIYQVKQKK